MTQAGMSHDLGTSSSGFVDQSQLRDHFVARVEHGRQRVPPVSEVVGATVVRPALPAVARHAIPACPPPLSLCFRRMSTASSSQILAMNNRARYAAGYRLRAAVLRPRSVNVS